MDEAAERERLIHNEKTKLEAEWFNNLSVAAFFAAFGTVPFVFLDIHSKGGSYTIALALYGILIASAIYFVWQAHQVIRRLR